MGRLGVVLKAWWNRLIGKAEKPDLILDLAVEDFETKLVRVKQGLADVATQKHRVKQEVAETEQHVERLEKDAQLALSSGNEDLALRTLERKQMIETQLQLQHENLGVLDQAQAELTAEEQELATQIDQFKSNAEIKKARYAAAKAQVQIRESMAGISQSGLDVGRTLGRVDSEMKRMEARSAGLKELTKNGALPNVLGGSSSPLELELTRERAKAGAKVELEAMRARLGLPAATREIDASPAKPVAEPVE